MKKIIALSILMVLVFTAGTFAGSDMIGKTVEGTFPLHINGQIAPVECIVIDGKSYAPVRFVGEAAGYAVDFQNNQVYLVNPEATVSIQPKESVRGSDAVDYYKVKSGVIELNGPPASYIFRDNEIYYPVALFSRYYSWDGVNVVTITMPWGKSTSFNKANTYETGINGFSEKGRSYIGVSAVGLKAIVNDGQLWLDKAE